ncbi:MAG: S66 family peptidase [Psychromonas sp.]
MKYPRPLDIGSKIGITAFSPGVPSGCHDRLDLVIKSLKDRGFEVLEGINLRSNEKHVSANARDRANELMTFLCDDSLDAIFPPWGGELAMEILPFLDFKKIAKAQPKWIIGFSDVSTILAVITTRLGWATAHTANLMQLHPKQDDSLTSKIFDYLNLTDNAEFTQFSSDKYEVSGFSFAENPNATFNLTAQTLWKVLNKNDQNCEFSGRLIGGCFDTLSHIIGTEYFDIRSFVQQHNNEGVILYLENAEMSSTAYLRGLLSLKYKGFLKLVNGLLIGRNAAANNGDKDISDYEALTQALYDVDIPVVYDADIGHLSPNMTLLNGVYAKVELKNGMGSITQTLK